MLNCLYQQIVSRNSSDNIHYLFLIVIVMSAPHIFLIGWLFVYLLNNYSPTKCFMDYYNQIYRIIYLLKHDRIYKCYYFYHMILHHVIGIDMWISYIISIIISLHMDQGIYFFHRKKLYEKIIFVVFLSGAYIHPSIFCNIIMIILLHYHTIYYTLKESANTIFNFGFAIGIAFGYSNLFSTLIYLIVNSRCMKSYERYNATRCRIFMYIMLYNFVQLQYYENSILFMTTTIQNIILYILLSRNYDLNTKTIIISTIVQTMVLIYSFFYLYDDFFRQLFNYWSVILLYVLYNWYCFNFYTMCMIIL